MSGNVQHCPMKNPAKSATLLKNGKWSNRLGNRDLHIARMSSSRWGPSSSAAEPF
jgi:hypothetical protein